MSEPRARPILASVEAKLYAVAAIALVYLVAWRGIARPDRPAAPVARTAPRAAWLDELPPSARPLLAPPAGWRVAARVETPLPVRAPASQPLRVRTRSS